MADQDRWLDAACAQGWTRNELRRRLRAQRLLAAARSRVLRVEVSGEREQCWREAAQASDRTLEAWVTSALDDAARPHSDQRDGVSRARALADACARAGNMMLARGGVAIRAEGHSQR